MGIKSFFKLKSNKAATKLFENIPELKALKFVDGIVEKDIKLGVMLKIPHISKRITKYLIASGVVITAGMTLHAYLEVKQKQLTGCFRYEFNSEGGVSSLCKVAQCTCFPDAAFQTSTEISLCAPDSLTAIQRAAKCSDDKTPCIYCKLDEVGEDLPPNVVYMCQTPSQIDVLGLAINWAVVDTKSFFGKLINVGFKFLNTLATILPIVGLVLIVAGSVWLYKRYTPTPSTSHPTTHTPPLPASPPITGI